MSAVFSILISVYNVEKYLAECLDSVKAQTFTDFEAIIVDDGSDDSSGSIADSYAVSDSRFHVFHTNNQGVLMARRYAASKSSGKYILNIDSDDYLEPDLLECVMAQFEAHGCDMVMYDFKSFDTNGLVHVETYFDSPVSFVSHSEKETLFGLLLSTRLNSLCTKCYVRRLIDIPLDYNKFHGLFHSEDLLQSSYLICNADKISYINKPLYNYRVGIPSASHNFDKKSIQRTSEVLKVIFSLMYENGFDNEKNTVEYKCMCRKYMSNYIRSCVQSGLSVGECVLLIKAAENTEAYLNSFDSSCDTYFGALANLKFFLLQRRLYYPLIILQKIKG